MCAAQATNADGAKHNTTALCLAARHGQVEAAALLLDHKASPDKPSSDGATPLMAAAAVGAEAVVRLLMERGASALAADPTTGLTAFHYGALRLGGAPSNLPATWSSHSNRTLSHPPVSAACLKNHPGCAEVLARAGFGNYLNGPELCLNSAGCGRVP